MRHERPPPVTDTKFGSVLTVWRFAHVADGSASRPYLGAAQFMADDVIALFEFTVDETAGRDEVRKVDESHYRLVAPGDLSREELERYRQRSGL